MWAGQSPYADHAGVGAGGAQGCDLPTGPARKAGGHSHSAEGRTIVLPQMPTSFLRESCLSLVFVELFQSPAKAAARDEVPLLVKRSRPCRHRRVFTTLTGRLMETS